MPTLTHVVRTRDKSAVRYRVVMQYTGPATYVTGGDSFTADDVKLGEIEYITEGKLTNGTVILLPQYDYTNSKMKVFDLVGAEVANGTVLSAYTCRFEAMGKG